MQTPLITRLLLPVLSSALLLGCSSSPEGASADIESEHAIAAKGASLFSANCGSCHSGGGNVLDPQKPIKGSHLLSSFESFEEFLRHPSGNMPSFNAETLPENEAHALYNFLVQQYPPQ
jgi:cytochrome c6